MGKKTIVVFSIALAMAILYFMLSNTDQVNEEAKASSSFSAEAKGNMVAPKIKYERVSRDEFMKQVGKKTLENLPTNKELNSSSSKYDINNIIYKLKNIEKNHQITYQDILDLFKSDMLDKDRVLLIKTLSDLGTYKSAVTLTRILDLYKGNPVLVDANKKAIENLVYDKVGRPNELVSSALTEYLDSSDNPTYKPIVATSILKIGNIRDSDHLINKLNNSTNDYEIGYISDAMKEIDSEELTGLVYKKYNTENSSETLKDASIAALPYIVNKAAVLDLFGWASKTSDIDKVEEYFKTIKKQNSKATMIIKEELFNNAIKFESTDVKDTISRIFKQPSSN